MLNIFSLTPFTASAILQINVIFRDSHFHQKMCHETLRQVESLMLYKTVKRPHFISFYLKKLSKNSFSISTWFIFLAQLFFFDRGGREEAELRSDDGCWCFGRVRSDSSVPPLSAVTDVFTKYKYSYAKVNANTSENSPKIRKNRRKLVGYHHDIWHLDNWTLDAGPILNAL